MQKYYEGSLALFHSRTEKKKNIKIFEASKLGVCVRPLFLPMQDSKRYLLLECWFYYYYNNYCRSSPLYMKAELNDCFPVGIATKQSQHMQEAQVK